MLGVDFIFHVVASKQVPSCEFFAIEAVNTNVLGTQYVWDFVYENNIKRMMVHSTNKSAYYYKDFS